MASLREPLVSKSVPESLGPILSDAEQAVAEGDIFAGFYHLRTILEHYLKHRLRIPIDQQIRGDELVTKHYQTLSPGAGNMLPSLTVSWEKLSHWLHTRTGDADDYQVQRDAICKHIEALEVLGDSAAMQNHPEDRA